MSETSEQAEATILGACLIDNKVIPDSLTVQDFESQRHRTIYEAILALDAKGDPADLLTIRKALGANLERAGGIQYLSSLLDGVPKLDNIASWVKIVKEASAMRILEDDISRVQRMLSEGANPSAILSVIENSAGQVRDRLHHHSGPKRLSDFLKPVLVDIENESEGLDSGAVMTGFTDLDDMIGGFKPSDLVILAAGTGIGKSSFAACVARNCKKPTLIVSLEMSGKSIARRILLGSSNINTMKVRHGLEEIEWERLGKSFGALSDVPIWIDDTARTPSVVRNIALKLRDKNSLGLLVVDYLQLMHLDGPSSSRAHEVGQISGSLKLLAMELDVPVLALSQFSRAAKDRKDKRPLLSDLKECVTGDTLVSLSDGTRIPIAELATSADVLSANEGSIIRAKASVPWLVGKREVFNVRLASGRSIAATEKHRLYSDYRWMKISELSIGDRVAIARTIPEPENCSNMSVLRITLLAHLIGDGSVLPGSCIKYTSQCEENLTVVSDAAKAEFGCTVKSFKTRSKCTELTLSHPGSKEKPIRDWLKSFGIYGKRSHEKFIPNEIFRLPNHLVSLFLRHLWATDGTICVGARGQVMIAYATNSIRLARDVMFLLQRFGIVSRLTSARKDNFRVGYMVSVQGVSNQNRFESEIGAFGAKEVQLSNAVATLVGKGENTNVDTLPKSIFVAIKRAMKTRGITQKKMTELRGTSYAGGAHYSFAPSRKTVLSYASILGDDSIAAMAKDDYFWDRIVAIDPIGRMDVYDISVPGPECWLADTIISHNSGQLENDADKVLLLHRDNAMVTSLTEVIVAKNRSGPDGTIILNFDRETTTFKDVPKEQTV